MTTKTRHAAAAAAFAAAALAGGCADQASPLATSALAPAQTAAAAPKIDPACTALGVRIDALRQDGVAERLEKVSAGKGKNVTVTRESLAKITELDKANAEFQARCAPGLVRPAQTAAAQPAAAIAPPAPAAKK